VFDLQEHIQWFFDPAGHRHPNRNFSYWMERVSLHDEFTDLRVVWYRDYRDASLQGQLEPLDDAAAAEARGGCCTTTCLLVVVALWRFGLPDPGVFLRAMVEWAWRMTQNPAKHQLLRMRLYRWQNAVTVASQRNDVVAARKLFGVAEEDNVVTGRCCGVFDGDDSVCTNGVTTYTVVGGAGPVFTCYCNGHLREFLNVR